MDAHASIALDAHASMPATCETCGFPLDPGASCPRCGAARASADAESPEGGTRPAHEGPRRAGGTHTPVPSGPVWIRNTLSRTPPVAPVSDPAIEQPASRTAEAESDPRAAMVEQPDTAPPPALAGNGGETDGAPPPEPDTNEPARPDEERPRRVGVAFDRAHTHARLPAVATTGESDGTPGLGSRAAAFGLDALFVGGIVAAYLVVGAIAYGLGDLAVAGGGSAVAGAMRLLAEAPAAAAACGILLFAVASAYFVWFPAAENRTPGMAVFGLRVVRTDGSSLGLWGAMQRWGAFLLAGALFGLGLLWTAFSDVQRGLHDHLSGTAVRRA